MVDTELESPLNGLLKFLSALPLFSLLAWVVVFAFILLGIWVFLRQERHRFHQRQKGVSWLLLRLLSLPLLGLMIALLILPARGISGVEGALYFWVALVTIAPLFWFGSHIFLGYLLKPALTPSESSLMATMGLAIILIPPLIISVAQMPIFMASASITQLGFSLAAQSPLAHQPGTPERFSLPNVGEVYAIALIAPMDVVLERIDQKTGSEWYDTKNSMQSKFCRNGEDIHLFWSSGETSPNLRLYWHDSHGKRHQGIFSVDPATLTGIPAKPFTVSFRQDGFDPPVPIPRDRAYFGYQRSDGKLYFDGLSFLQPDESFTNNCLKRGYRRVAWEKEGPIQTLMLNFQSPPGSPPIKGEVHRPVEGTLNPQAAGNTATP